MAALCASLLFGAPALAEDPLTLHYKGRQIDSAPYSYAFPYRLEEASIASGKLYFSRHIEGEGKQLFTTDWDPTQAITLDSTKAVHVTHTNLNTINFWGRAFNKQLNGLIVEADDDKAERINLWAFTDGSQMPRQLTDVDYVYEFAQSDDHRHIYYTARYGSSDAAKGCLEELSIHDDGSARSRQLVCDDGSDFPARINWWTNLRADDRRIIFPALKDGDRNQQELYAYDLESGAVTQLFQGHGASWVTVLNTWGDETQALFSSDRDLYRYDFTTGEALHLKTFDRAIANVALAGPGRTPPLLVTTESPFETRLQLLEINANTATVLSDTRIPEDAWLADGHDGIVLMGRFSPETYAAFDILTFREDGTFTTKDAVTGLAKINDQLGQCDVERVQVGYEDTHPATRGHVTLDVFLYRPKDPPPLADQKFIITAYYGGENTFSSYHHLWCALGLTTASPAVRGDWRYGTEFANSNDREKADAPIRDTLAVARYLVDRYDIQDTRQIGVTGYSHGAWAAIRTLSYPGPERLDLGFAIAGGGFYDLPAIVDPAKASETNIHGWFDKEFGTADQLELLQSLSPAAHLDQIKAPIFLYHGERDTRVSPQQSKSLAAGLEERGKAHQLLIIPKQGHSLRGPRVWAGIRQGILDMIASLP